MLISCLFLAYSCVSEEDILQTEKIEQEKKAFAIFSQSSNIQGKSNKSAIDYASGFSILMQRYDSIHNTNISGLVNTTNIVEHKKNSLQNVIVESKEFYIENRLHSQTIFEENGDVWVMYPKIKNNSVEDLLIASYTDNGTNVFFRYVKKDSELYVKNINLFQEKFDKQINRIVSNKSNSDLCGYDDICYIDGPIITPNPGGGNCPLCHTTPPENPGSGCDQFVECIYNDIGGSGGNGTGEIPLAEVVIKAAIKDKPFAFIDVPCDIIKQWLNTAKHTVSNDIISKLNNISKKLSTTTAYGSISTTNVAKLQDINNAYSTVVNMDYFPITIDKLPPGVTAEQLLNHIRTNINSFVDTNYSYFEPYHWNGINDTDLWGSSNPLGAVIGIDIKGPDNGSVVVTKYSSNGWTFSTIYDPTYLSHPVSGHRDFGFTKNTNGSYTFYTRGVDRLTSWDGEFFQKFGNIPFSQADNLWKSLQNKISEYVNSKGGSASVNTPQIKRPDWQTVKDVIDRKKPLSTLSNDCK